MFLIKMQTSISNACHRVKAVFEEAFEHLQSLMPSPSDVETVVRPIMEKYATVCYMVIMISNLLIIWPQPLAALTYALLDEDHKRFIKTGSEVDNSASRCCVVCVATFAVLCGGGFTFATGKTTNVFGLVWLFAMSFVMRGVFTDDREYYMSSIVSLVFFPYILTQTTRYNLFFHAVILFVPHIVLTVVAISLNNGIFDANAELDVNQVWLVRQYSTALDHPEVGVTFAISLCCFCGFFTFGEWVASEDKTGRWVGGAAVLTFLVGLVVAFFPMTFILPGSNFTSNDPSRTCMAALRLVQFCVVLATNSCLVLETHNLDRYKHFAQRCVIVVLGCIMQSFVATVGPTQVAYRAFGVVVVVFSLQKIHDWLYHMTSGL